MALALSNAGRLTADIRLAQAVSNYEVSLSDSQKAEFRTLKYKTRTTAPSADDVMRLTAEMDRQARRKIGAWRCFGPRFTNILHTVQQYAALGDIVIGGTQNLVACGVWCVVRTSLLVGRWVRHCNCFVANLSQAFDWILVPPGEVLHALHDHWPLLPALPTSCSTLLQLCCHQTLSCRILHPCGRYLPPVLDIQ